MISVAQAHDAVAALVRETPTEMVPLHQAAGRVLRRDALATLTQPPFSASAMDGYAVSAGDKVTGRRLQVVGEVAAGGWPEFAVAPGQAARVFTGAPMPPGTDTVIIQEDVTRSGDEILVGDALDAAPYVRPAGNDFAKGDTLDAPRRLFAADIGLLASMNVPHVEVARRPLVAIIPTGDELTSVGEAPDRGQIIASSALAVRAMLEQAGAVCRILPIARDTAASLSSTLDLARDADVIITLGGASVGDHDLVQEVSTSRGLALSFYKIAMRPGKPLICGTLDQSAFLGLPGNPVSSLVCARIFGVPLVRAMQGLDYTPPHRFSGRLEGAIGQNGPRAHYMRSVASFEGDWRVQVSGRQDSALMSVLSRANALVVRPPNAPPAHKGERVEFILLNETFC